MLEKRQDMGAQSVESSVRKEEKGKMVVGFKN